MKNLICFLMLIACFRHTMAQAPASPSFDAAYYLKKSKDEKTGAWVILGLGTGLIVIGTGATVHGKYDDTLPWDSNSTNSSASTTSGGFIFIAGAFLAVSSIPLFASANKHKRMAATLSIGNLPRYMKPEGVIIPGATPGMSLKINF